MKILSGLSAVFLGAAVWAAPAGDKAFGLGLIAGDPFGISAKVPAGSMNAIDMIVGGGHFYRNGGFFVDADYVWFNPKVIPPVSQGRFTLYYGPGVNISGAGGGAGIGVRFVAGIEYLFAESPFDAFLELGPGIALVPEIWPDFSGGLGARFFFR